MRRFRVDPSNIEDDSNPLDIYLTTPNPDAQIIQELIINHYSHDLLRIITAVFDDDWRQQPDSEQIKQIFAAILNEASTTVDQFTRFGESKVWLFNLASKITLKRYRTARWRKHIQLRIFHQPNIQSSPLIETDSQPYCQFLDQLKPFERISILLFQYFGLSTEQVEKILERSPRKLSGVYNKSHPSQNIDTAEIKRLNETLNSVLISRYDPDKYLNDYIISHQDIPCKPIASKYQFKQKLWNYIKDSFVLIGLFVCTIVLISYLRAIEPSADPNQISSNLSTPTPITEAPTYIATISPRGLVDLMGSVTTPLLYTSEPSLSHDGRYLVFSSTLDFLLPGETNNTTDIYIFDRQTGTFERLSDPNNDSLASISHYSPGISADGRWITFASQEPYLIRGVIDVCSDTNQRYKCPTIFLHDRLTGSTIPITRETKVAVLFRLSRQMVVGLYIGRKLETYFMKKIYPVEMNNLPNLVSIFMYSTI
jgi:DNA-directed RNA polymerase specialized sigma24 family protein